MSRSGRPGAAVGPWWVEHAVGEREPARLVHPRRALVEQPLAEHDVAEQPALLRQPDLGAVGELARLAEVVHERGVSSRSEFSRGCSTQVSTASVPTATVCSSRPPR